MAQIKCKVCGCSTAPAADRRCGLCRKAKAATDAGTSYGKLQAMLYDLFGDSAEASADAFRICPVCRRTFFPHRNNQIYDNKLCAQRAASRKYYKAKKCNDAGHLGSGRSTGGTNGADIANQISRGTDSHDAVAPLQEK